MALVLLALAAVIFALGWTITRAWEQGDEALNRHLFEGNNDYTEMER